MSIKDLLDAELTNFRPRNFKDWLEVASDEDREAVLHYINAGTIPAHTLAVTLAKAGVPCTRETILKMRDKT